MKMILFLDFDGVLHPTTNISKYFSRLPHLEEVLRDFPDIQIVLTTTWRTAEDMRDLKQHFSPDIAERIIGTTEEIEVDSFQRYKEILDFLKKNKLNNKAWVALDDQAFNFPDHAPVVLTNSNEGLAEASINYLIKAFSGERVTLEETNIYGSKVKDQGCDEGQSKAVGEYVLDPDADEPDDEINSWFV